MKNIKDAQFIPGPWQIREFHILGTFYTLFVCIFHLLSIDYIPFDSRVGDLNAITLNNLNLRDDVVRWSRPSGNIIRAAKSFKSININRFDCRSGCTVQGVDAEEWLTKGVLPNLNYTIQGNVYVNNAAISFVQALGLVNNNTFNSNTILLKSAQQQIDHVISIGTFSNANNITPLTFNEIDVNFINDRNFTEFYKNLISRNAANEIVGNVFSNMQFTKALTFDNLFTSNRLKGFHHIDGAQFRMISNELDDMAEKINEHQHFKHFHRMVLRQTLPSKSVQSLSKIVDFDHDDVVKFVAWNGNDIEFYTWNQTTSTLEIDPNGKLLR